MDCLHFGQYSSDAPKSAKASAFWRPEGPAFLAGEYGDEFIGFAPKRRFLSMKNLRKVAFDTRLGGVERIFYNSSRARSRTRRLAMVLVALFAAGCAGHSRPVPATPNRAVIAIPGYKGSVLEDENGTVLWITLRQALFGDTPLDRDVSTLHATGILKRVSVIPWLYGYNAYGEWLDSFGDRLPKDTLFVELAYDWRQDNVDAARVLSQKVEELHARGIDRIDVVAHSMGGLVASYFLRYGAANPGGPETWAGAARIDSLVTIGAPFRGTVKMLRDFQRDSAVLFNTALLSAKSVRSFPSCYQLLPRRELRALRSPEGRTLDVDTFSEDLWKEQGWMSENGEIDERLAAGRAFSDALNNPSSSAAPQRRARILVIRGIGQATDASCVLLDSPRGRLLCNDEEARAANIPLGNFSDDGDGVVTGLSSRAPDAFVEYGAELLNVTGEHAEMLILPAVQDRIARFLGLEAQS